MPGKPHGWRAWWTIVHGVTKSRTQLSDFTFTKYIMRNAGLDELQAVIKIGRRNINNFRYADNTTQWQKTKRN